MNAVLTTLLILALAIAIFFDFIRIVQYIQSKKFMDESNKWAENKFNEVNSQLTQLQTDIDLIYAMEQDSRVRQEKTIDLSHAILKQTSLFVKQEIKIFKQLEKIQDTLHKIEKRK